MAKADMTPFGEVLPEDMSFQELMDAGIIEITEIDDVVAIKQDLLLGVPFILFSWEPRTGDMGDYVICRVKTAQGTRVFADGGTGIPEQLGRYRQKLNGQTAHIYFPNGLRKSDYRKTLDDGSTVNATTYYLDNSPAK